ncbi:AbrB family transcriptional regulator [Aquibium carbonis]|uniref:AbrB family transcriptional regulator n=1 Tax=Aquibium carbonis TaxID=2495581 RepID=A0A3R9YGH3_9HYPH|nr:AbrB family transcriptional regulator [Aquibium carbonis]RST87081.1 AbrB family transcriptional regulator [Aquibium carbonis]
MSEDLDQPARLARFASPWQWLLLVMLSTIIAIGLEFAALPAALLIGPMIAAIVAGVSGATVRPAPSFFVAAQGIIGCVIVSAIEPSLFRTLLSGWPVIVAAVLSTLAASSLLGMMVARWGSMPGTTAVWGSAPGAASAMVVMADAFGADARLVAFMQYLRVLIVSISAAVLARIWIDVGDAARPPVDWLPHLILPDFAMTLVIALVGAFGGRMTGIPGATLLGPLLIGIPLHLGLGLDLQLPEWLLATSYAIIGWSIGLRFTRPILLHAARSLPQIIGAILVLTGFCAAVGAVLAATFDVDPLTAFLATSPGGMDSVAIIAAASGSVDLSFVMTLQMTRFLIVLIVGPPLAKAIAMRMNRRPP